MESPLLTPPTDNLYKFTAISGLAVLVVAGYAALEFEKRIGDQVAAAQAAADLEGVRAGHLERRNISLEELIQNSIAEQKGERPPNPDKLTLHYSNDEVKSLVEKSRDLFQDAALARAAVKSHVRDCKRILDRGIVLLNFALVFAIGGAFLTVYGFWLWYSRLQRYTDIYVRGRANEATKK